MNTYDEWAALEKERQDASDRAQERMRAGPKSRAPKRVNRRGPVADKVTIQGVTDTYAGFGAKVGLLGNSFRIRVRKLGLDHPMILATRQELDAWWREGKEQRRREKVKAETGKTVEQHRAEARAVQNRRAYARRRINKEAKRAMKGTLIKDREVFTEAVGHLLEAGEEFLTRYRHRGLWQFLRALDKANDPTPEELAEMENFQQGDQCEDENSPESTTCASPAVKPGGAPSVELPS